MAEQDAWANVKPMPDRKRVPAFSPFLYKYRNLVERFFSKIKHFRAVATRYDKDPDNFLASVKLAALRVWLRTLRVRALERDLFDQKLHWAPRG